LECERTDKQIIMSFLVRLYTAVFNFSPVDDLLFKLSVGDLLSEPNVVMVIINNN